MKSIFKPRLVAFQREADEKLENLRDDCIALFLNSGLTQKQIHERGGPTPQTTSKWLYKETKFPRHETLEKFMIALGCEMVVMSAQQAARFHNQPREIRLGLEKAYKPLMPAKKKAKSKKHSLGNLAK